MDLIIACKSNKNLKGKYFGHPRVIIDPCVGPLRDLVAWNSF